MCESEMKLGLQKGVTLIEVMVAVTLSLVILAGVMQLFISSKETYRINDMISQIQESGRFAVETVSRDLRITGYQGCADPAFVDAINIVINTPPTTDYRSTALIGVEGGSVSDNMSMQFASATGVALASASDPVNAKFTIAQNTAGFTVDDVLMVSDCASAHLFRVTAVTEVGGQTEITYNADENDLTKLTKSYSAGTSQLMHFQRVTYSVADTGRKNQAGMAIPGLFKKVNNSTPVEMVQGVENMQIEYAERLDGGNLRYAAADDANLNMANVVSVRLGLLLQTTELSATREDNMTYKLVNTSVEPEGTAGATVTHAKDKRFRRVFNTTIYLRNR